MTYQDTPASALPAGPAVPDYPGEDEAMDALRNLDLLRHHDGSYTSNFPDIAATADELRRHGQETEHPMVSALRRREPQLTGTLDNYLTQRRARGLPEFPNYHAKATATRDKWFDGLYGNGLDKLGDTLTKDEAAAIEAAAATADDPDEIRAKSVNQAWLAAVAGRPLSADEYPAARDYYARTLKLDGPVTEKGLYSAIASRKAEDKKYTAAFTPFLGEAWKTALVGEPDKVEISKTLEKIPEHLRAGFSDSYHQARREARDLRRRIMPLVESIKGSVKVITDDTLPGTREQAVRALIVDMANRLPDIPAEQDAALAVIGAELAKLPPDQRAGITHIGNALERGINTFVEGIKTYGIAGENLARGGALDENLAVRTKVAKLKGVLFDPESGALRLGDQSYGMATRMLTGAAQSAVYLPLAMIPVAGPAAMAASFAGQSYQDAAIREPDANPAARFAAASVSGPVQAGIETVFNRFGVKVFRGKLPTLTAILNRTGIESRLGRGAIGATAGTAAVMGTEYAEEAAQGFTDTALQDLATEFSGLMPDTDWEKFWHDWLRPDQTAPYSEQRQTLLAITPLALLAGGGAAVHHVRGASYYLRNATMLRAAGLTPQETRQVLSAPTDEAAADALRRNFAAAQSRAATLTPEQEAEQAAARVAAIETLRDRQQELDKAGLPVITQDTNDFTEETRYTFTDPNTGAATTYDTEEEALEAYRTWAGTLETDTLAKLEAAARPEWMENLTGEGTAAEEAAVSIDTTDEARTVTLGTEQDAAQAQLDEAQRAERSATGPNARAAAQAKAEDARGKLAALEARFKIFIFDHGLSPSAAAETFRNTVIRAKSSADYLRDRLVGWTVRLFQGATMQDIGEDVSESVLKNALANGLADPEAILEDIYRFEEATGARVIAPGYIYSPENSMPLVEAFSKLARGYMFAEANSGVLPPSVQKWVQVAAAYSAAVVDAAGGAAAEVMADIHTAARLREGIQAGHLSESLRSRIADSIGMNEKERFARLQRQQEEQLAAEALGDFPEISESLRGRLPHPVTMKDKGAVFAGEVRRIWESMLRPTRRKDKRGQEIDRTNEANAYFLPRGKYEDLDLIRRNMNELGYSFDTPADMLEALERSLSYGKPTYGTKPPDFGESYAIGRITPKQDADYLAAVQSGDMETAQRMVDELLIENLPSPKDGEFVEVVTTALNSKRDAEAQLLPTGGILIVRSRWFNMEIYGSRLFDEAVSPLARDEYIRVTNNQEDFKYLKEGKHRGSLNRNVQAWEEPKSEGGLSVAKTPEFPAKYAYFVKGKLSHRGTDGDPVLDLANIQVLSDLLPYEKAIKRFENLQKRPAPFARPIKSITVESADPVTRDADGNVIPLSQRFNPARAEITYALGRATVTPTAETRVFPGAPGSPSLIGPATFALAPYAGQHRPNDEGPRAFDLSENDLMPADVYEHPEWYSAMGPKIIRETMAQLRKAKGKAEQLITIYRAGPAPEINTGDWISLSPEYARTHAMGIDSDQETKVWQAEVPAEQVRWSMDDLAEFGFFGDTTPAKDSGLSFSLAKPQPSIARPLYASPSRQQESRPLAGPAPLDADSTADSGTSPVSNALAFQSAPGKPGGISYALSMPGLLTLDSLLTRMATQGPDERAAIYEKMRNRLAASILMVKEAKRNIATDQSEAETERNRIRDALTEAQAIIAALPPEARAKVRMPVADILNATSERGQINALVRLIAQADDAIEDALIAEYRSAFETLLDLAKPDLRPNKQLRGRLTPAIQREVATVLEVASMDPATHRAAVIRTEAALEALQQEQPDTPEAIAANEAAIAEQSQYLDALTTYGPFSKLSAAELSAALETLRTLYTTGRTARRILDENRQAALKAARREVVSSNPEVGHTRHAKGKAAANLAANFLLGLSSFHQVMEYFFPHSITARDMQDRVRAADRAMTWDRINLRDRYDAFTFRAWNLTGPSRRRKRNQIVQELSKIKDNWGISFFENAATEEIKLDEDQAAAILGGTMKTGWENDPIALQSLGDALTDFRMKRLKAQAEEKAFTSRVIKFKRVTHRGKPADLTVSQLSAAYLLQLWAQPQYRPALDRYGFTESIMDQIEAKLDPRAADLLDFMRQEYDAEYDKLNPVFRAIYGMDMPRIRNYAPGVFEHMDAKAGSDSTIDPEGGVAGVNAMSAGFTKQRQHHIARPDDQANALSQFFAHQESANYFVHYAELVRDMRAIFRHPEVRRQLNGLHGQRSTTLFYDWLDGIELDGRFRAKEVAALTRLGNRMLAGRAMTGLAFNLGTLLKQVSAATGFLMEMPTGQALKGIARAIMHPAEYAGTVRTLWGHEAIRQRILQGISPEDRQVLDAAANSPSWIMDALEAGRLPIAYVDAAMTSLSGAVAYTYARQTALDATLPPEQAEAAGIAAAVRVIERTAQPATTQDKSMAELTPGFTMRLLTQFKSDPRQKAAMIANAVMGYRAGRVTKSELARKIAFGWMSYGLLNAAMADLALSIFRDDDEPDKWTWQDYLAAMLAGPLSAVPILGGLMVNALASAGHMAGGKQRPFTSGASPMEDGLDRLPAAVLKTARMWEDITDEKASNDPTTNEVLTALQQFAGATASLTGAAPAALTAALTRIARDVQGAGANLLDTLAPTPDDEALAIARTFAAESTKTRDGKADERKAMAKELADLPAEERARRMDALPPKERAGMRSRLKRAEMTASEVALAELADAQRAAAIAAILDKLGDREREARAERYRQLGLTD